MSKELAKNRKDGELLVVEVGLRMQHEDASKKCQKEFDNLQEEIIKSGETKDRR